MRTMLTFTTLAFLLGCASTAGSARFQIHPGARQDSNTEIAGKPQGANPDSEVQGVGYDQQGGEMSAQAAEQAAAGPVQYHYHVHVHHQAGSSTEVPGMPTAAAPGSAPTGYAAPQFSTHVHHSGFNFYANPYSVPTSPYANNPNDGNSKSAAYPYYSNIPGTGQPYGVGRSGYASGGFNPYANDGSGAFGWSGDG